MSNNHYYDLFDKRHELSMTKLVNCFGSSLIAKNKKHKTYYKIIGLAFHHETLMDLVIYSPIRQGKEVHAVKFVRPLKEFTDKFERTDL